MPRITTKISAILGRHLLIFLGIYEFLAFLTALEIFLLNEKYFSTYSKKTYFYKKKIFGWDTARPKWLPVGQPNLNLSCLDFTIPTHIQTSMSNQTQGSGKDIFRRNFEKSTNSGIKCLKTITCLYSITSFVYSNTFLACQHQIF